MKKLLWIAYLLASYIHVFGQTFNGGGIAIPDNGPVVTSTITVNQLAVNSIDTSIYGLESVCVNITHPYVADVRLVLEAPDGTTVLLVDGVGGGGDDFAGTCFKQSAPNSIVTGSAPFSGFYRPMGQLGRVNNGQSGTGQWKLRLQDTYPSDSGQLLSWSLVFSTQPAKYLGITSSNLPLFLFDTQGQTIVDEPKIKVRLKVVNNGPGQRNLVNSTQFHYNGFAGIEYRGSSSQLGPKKPFGFETWDSLGAEFNFPLLGFPSEHDWTLIANYSDKSLIRNALLYESTRLAGRYAARSKLVEVLVNGEYQGVYLFTEKLKRDANRVNISKLNPTDTSGNRLSGGYIIKIDKTTGSGGSDGFNSMFAPLHNGNGQSIRFLYDYPSESDIHPAQKNYIKSVIDSFETSLAGSGWLSPSWGYKRFIDVGSFIDFYLLNEIARNVDGYRISTYLHKNRNTNGFSPLVMGPMWDFDLSFGNANYCQGSAISGWAWQFNQVCPSDYNLIPFWWEKMVTDPSFNNQARCRWNSMRQGAWSNLNMMARIDSMATLLQESQARNFAQWPILGIYVWPNVAPFPTTYGGEVQRLKQWLQNRLTWIDQNLPGICTTTSTENLVDDAQAPWPNPCKDFLNMPGYQEELWLSDLWGRTHRIRSEEGKPFSVQLLKPGIYVVVNGISRGKRIVIFE